MHSTYPSICCTLIPLTSRGFPTVSHCSSLCQNKLKQHGFLANLEGSMMPCRTFMIGLALWCCPWHGASSGVGTCWRLWPHGGRRVCNSNFKDGNGNILSLSQWLSYLKLWYITMDSSWHQFFCKCFAMIFLKKSFSHDGTTKAGSWKFDMVDL